MLRARTLFTKAKHKIKKKSFKAGIREQTLGYGLPNNDEITSFGKPFNQEFFNFGVIVPRGAEK
jgi:hypothetical protein